MSFLSPHDLHLGYGLTLKNSARQSLDEKLTPFSPTVYFRVKPDEHVRDLILLMLSTLRHAFRGSRNKLAVLDVINVALTRPTSANQELWNAVANNPLLGVCHISIPNQRARTYYSTTDFVNIMLKATTNVESYECHAYKGVIRYGYQCVNNHHYLKCFCSNNNFIERFEGFHVRGTVISEVSIEGVVFHTSVPSWAEGMDGVVPSYFLLTDHVQLEKVNIAGARHLRTGGREPVPQLILMEFVRKNKSLRWIKRDLTSASIFMMKEERTEIMFISSHVEM